MQQQLAMVLHRTPGWFNELAFFCRLAAGLMSSSSSESATSELSPSLSDADSASSENSEPLSDSDPAPSDPASSPLLLLSSSLSNTTFLFLHQSPSVKCRRCHPRLTDVLDSGNKKLKKKHYKSALWPGLQQAVRCDSSAKEIEMSKDFRRHLRLTTAGFVPPEVLGVSITTVSFEASFPANVSFWEEGSFADASASDEGCEGSLSCRLFRMAASICSCSFLDVAAGALCVEWRVFFRANSIGKGLPGATGTRAFVSIKTCELTSHTWAALLSFLGSCRRDSRSAF